MLTIIKKTKNAVNWPNCRLKNMIKTLPNLKKMKNGREGGFEIYSTCSHFLKVSPSWWFDMESENSLSNANRGEN